MNPSLQLRPAHLHHAAVAAVLSCVIGTALAGDWRYLETPTQERVLTLHYRNGVGDTLWSLGDDGVRCSEGERLRAVHRSATSTRLPEDGVRDLFPLADGGALLDTSAIRNHVGGYCAAERVGADGRLRWRAELRLGDEACHGLFANGTGQSWFLAAEKLFALDADGRIGAQPANVGQPYWTRPVAVLSDGSAISATRLRGETTSRLARFDTQGRELWHWVRTDQKTLALVTIAGDGVVALALAPDGLGTAAMDLSRWSFDGHLQWTYALPPHSRFFDIVAADGGDVYVILGDSDLAFPVNHAKSVQRIGADGRLQWEKPINCRMSRGSATPVARTVDDGFAYVCESGTLASLLVRLDRNGEASSLPLPIDITAQLLPRPGGRLLVHGLQLQSPGPPVRRTLIVDGTSVATAPFDEQRDTAPSQLLGQQIFPDGSSVIATVAQTPVPGVTVTKLAADGRRVWTQRVSAQGVRSSDALAAGSGLVCIALDSAAAPPAGNHMDGLACLDADDGEFLWDVQLPQRDGYFGALGVGDDGRIRTLRWRTNEHELLRFARDGTLESTIHGPHAVQRAAFDTRGAATVVTDEALRQYEPDGRLRLNFGASGAAVSLNQGTTALIASDDGNIWIAGRPYPPNGKESRLWAISADARTRWTRDFAATNFSALQLHQTALYGVGTRSGSTGVDRSVEVALERLDAATGTPAWTYTSRHHPFTTRGSAFAIGPASDAIVLAHSEFERLHLEQLDAVSGNLVHDAWLACDALCGAPAALSLDATHTARTAFDVLDRDRGQTGAVVASDLSAATTRLDQPGIAGAWWSPYAHGEGIAFDWLPVSRTLFGAWFTFSTTGGNETEQLRWYTLQANGVADGARRLDLPILETTGGNFDAAPNVSPRRVGTAQVEFHDCARATLRYAFDANVNEARSGTITLSRLSPATQPCVLADGSTQPAPGAQPPAHGFDAKQSGTWFDETAVGQGLQFTVQPNGTFFAPWFTFDPADAGDDPGRQHWFTLQGNLAEARDGVAPLVLVQTLGGRFDSVPTYNATAIGTATLRLRGCDRADLDYRFDDIPGAGAFRGRSGSLRLSRAGGCAP